jgi:hypothetical protein
LSTGRSIRAEAESYSDVIARLAADDQPGPRIGNASRRFDDPQRVGSPTLAILCEPCGRRGRCNVQRLIAKHGADVKLPDLRAVLATCEKAHSFSIYDRCKAKYEGL